MHLVGLDAVVFGLARPKREKPLRADDVSVAIARQDGSDILEAAVRACFRIDDQHLGRGPDLP